jgi:hypothetical protein
MFRDVPQHTGGHAPSELEFQRQTKPDRVRMLGHDFKIKRKSTGAAKRKPGPAHCCAEGDIITDGRCRKQLSDSYRRKRRSRTFAQIGPIVGPPVGYDERAQDFPATALGMNHRYRSV